MRINDAVWGALLLALALFVYLEAGTFRTMPGVPYGPGLFPRIIAVVLALSGVLLFASGLRRSGGWRAIELAEWARLPRSYVLFAAVVGGGVAFALLAPRLGFALSAFAMLAVVLVVARGRRSLASSLLIAAVAVVATHLLFAQALRVPLPFGVVEQLMAG
jgi:putative tricarboxylic transport membrane protein